MLRAAIFFTGCTWETDQARRKTRIFFLHPNYPIRRRGEYWNFSNHSQARAWDLWRGYYFNFLYNYFAFALLPGGTWGIVRLLFKWKSHNSLNLCEGALKGGVSSAETIGMDFVFDEVNSTLRHCSDA